MLSLAYELVLAVATLAAVPVANNNLLWLLNRRRVSVHIDILKTLQFCNLVDHC